MTEAPAKVPTPQERAKRGFRRLVGLDRSGPPPEQTLSGQPLRPFTLPNLVGYLRLAAIPVFLVIALDSSDGRATASTLIFLAITLGDYLDGFLARATGQYSRMGVLLDPIVDRLTVLAGVIVCWNFEILPRWALALLVAREFATLVLSRYALRAGVEIEVNWLGRIATFLVFGGIFWSLVFDWVILQIGFVIGVLVGIAATVVYTRDGRARARAREAGCSPTG
ncbi:CDP-alcohol phosphatidyltransferase family protein [Thermoleophilia bacterium SCSIO 60948]|nr:CDP-alcohol phosphatidyltransferase family protein [Thermoleophilia bacterium SCSIO 60948]